MTDQRLRALERRWRETGAPHDEAELLRERARVGDLPEARLRAARVAGYVPARLAVDGDDEAESKGELVDALAAVGTSACVAAVLALAEAAADAVREALPEQAAVALGTGRAIADGAPAPADLDATLRALVDLALPRTKVGKRVRAAVDLVWLASGAAARGRRVARTHLLGALELAGRVLPEPLAALSTTLAPRLLHSDWPAEAPPVRLLVVEERFQVRGAGTVVQPGVDLELPAAGQLAFMVEVRDADVVQRCLARATLPFTQPPMRPRLHALVLPLHKALVPVDSVVWEVGP